MAQQDNDTIFGKILRGEIDADRVYEDEKCIAFRDVNPGAPKHFLVIPREHLVNLFDADESHEPLLGHLMRVAAEVAREQGLGEDGFRLVVNNEAGAGQTVFHLHLHVLGGRPLSWPPG